RPSTVDSIPLIGPFAKTKNVFAAFGHQHIGLTGGPKTGRWIAGMVAGTASNTDLSAFSPNRF
ncbi:MAG: FAD-dependent oxidoreductase, partial [Pseudomonadota bacterium]